MNKKGNDQITTVSEKKVYVVLAVIHFVIALIIIGVNLYFRFTDVHRGDGYEYVDGVIVNREVKRSYIGRRRVSETWITVKYTPKGTDKKREFI